METMSLCFDHPVAVKVFFICTSAPNLDPQIKTFRSDENGFLSIPLEGMVSGKWKLMLEWNHDGRDFCMEKNVEVPVEQDKVVQPKKWL